MSQENLLEDRTGNMSTADVAAMANQFYNAALAEYDKVIIGETQAKYMYIGALTMGGNNAMMAVSFGHPGTGKSKLMQYAESVVEGLGSEQTASVPHREDLTATELVGKRNSMEKTVEREGEESYTETLSTEVKAIIRPGVSVVKFDEINRTSPIAINAALDILQKGGVYVTHNGVDEHVSEFDLVTSGMNHYGTLFTHRLDPALLSRMAMGTELGVRETGMLTPAAEQLWDNPDETYTGDPGVKPVISHNNLLVLRNAIDSYPLLDDERKLGKAAALAVVEGLDGHEIPMGDPRLSAQMIRQARVFAMLRASDKVTDQDIEDASEFQITAKLGASGVLNHNNGKDLRAATEEVMDTVRIHTRG